MPDPTIENFPDELMPGLHTVLGQLVLSWGSLEASLNMAISISYHDAGGKALEPDMPRTQLKRRLDFMKKCASQLPVFASYKDHIIGLMSRIGTHAGIRNAVLHGYFSNYDVTTGLLTFTSLRGKDDHHEVSEITGTLEHLQRAAIAALNIGSEVIALSQALSQTFLGPHDEVHQPGGEGRV